MFAPVFHRSMQNVMIPRREVGIRTFFNLLGPMTNPAGVKNQVIGVYDASLAPTVARVLRSLGTERAMIVNGSGMDEFTISGTTRVVELNGHSINEYDVDPGSFGIDLAGPDELVGGNPAENARIMMSVLKGKQSPRSDIVVLNAGAGIYISGLASSMDEGVQMAAAALSSGASLNKLRQFAEVSSRLDSDRQREADPSSLSFSRLRPDVLAARSKEISRFLFSQASGTERGRTLLFNIDGALIDDPNVLSVILLRRIVSVTTTGLASAASAGPLARSRTTLSDAIASSPGIAVIAEYKPRSPTVPPLVLPPAPSVAAASYSRGGAVGMSVLAEPDFFLGGLDLFASMRSMTQLPMLLKDFVVSEEQLDAASWLGADSVLLIAQALTRDALGRFIQASLERNLEPFVEIHDTHDLDKLARCDGSDKVKMVGINSRDLKTLKVDISRIKMLRGQIGDGRLVIAESGLTKSADFNMIRGCDAALVGSAFMQADDLESKVSEIVAAGRGVAR